MSLLCHEGTVALRLGARWGPCLQWGHPDLQPQPPASCGSPDTHIPPNPGAGDTPLARTGTRSLSQELETNKRWLL